MHLQVRLRHVLNVRPRRCAAEQAAQRASGLRSLDDHHLLSSSFLTSRAALAQGRCCAMRCRSFLRIRAGFAVPYFRCAEFSSCTAARTLLLAPNAQAPGSRSHLIPLPLSPTPQPCASPTRCVKPELRLVWPLDSHAQVARQTTATCMHACMHAPAVLWRTPPRPRCYRGRSHPASARRKKNDPLCVVTLLPPNNTSL